MDFNYNQVLEHVDLNGMIAGHLDDGVLEGLKISEKSVPNMSVDVAIGNCFVNYAKYSESGITNVGISTAHASYARKDIIVYDTSAGAPVVVDGTASAIPEPPDIPHGDIILALVDVAAATAVINDSDITDKRVIITRVLEYVELQNISQASKLCAVLSGLVPSEKGTPDMSIDVASGSCQIDGGIYTESSTVNVVISAANATYDRRDIIIYDKSASNPAVVTGVALEHPVSPSLPDDDILLGIVHIPANATTIVNANITDKRIESALVGLCYVNHGTYVGNNTADRGIAHGLGHVPLYVVIGTAYSYRHTMNPNGYLNYLSYGSGVSYSVSSLDSTNFYVGHATNYSQSSNSTGATYYWVAFG